MEANTVIIYLKIHEHRLPDFPCGMFAAQRFPFPLQGFEK
jgi:hypothetical protein